jgi:glycosyltransferase involved in cell wall biosynthesis
VQDFDDFEVIGIDDGSTDNSADIFLAYTEDSRFTLVRHNENLGLPSARNTGLFLASRDLVYFLDSDDWIAPDALSKLHAVRESTNSDIVMGGVLKYEELDGSYYVPSNHRKVMDQPFTGQTIFEQPQIFHSVTSWNKLISMRFLKEKGLMFKTHPRRFEDMLTYKWYLSGARVTTLSDVTYYYRQRAPSGSGTSIMQHNHLSAIRDRFLAFADIYQYARDHDLLGTDFDPLHSRFAMFDLRRVLNWLVKKAYTEDGIDYAEKTTPTDEQFEVTLALKLLLSLFSEDYLRTSSKEVLEIHEIVMTRPLDKALQWILAKYRRSTS